jgi:hypothetical protein
MAHSTAAQYRNVLTGTVSHTVVFSTVLAHETLIVLFVDRTGGAVINSIADSASGSWTLRSSDATSTFLNALYVREDAAAATNLTVTIASNASQNSQVVGIRIATDAGGVVYPTYDDVGPHISNADAVASDSDLCDLSAGGCVVGGQSTSQAQAATPTLDVGDAIGPAGGAGVRSFAAFDAHATSGSYRLETTLGTSSASRWLIISFIDSAAAGGATAKRNLLLGVG